MSDIKKIHAREIFDSRGMPTIEVTVFTESSTGTCSVPSGASTGKYEAVELRDGGDRFAGRGVELAVTNVNEVISDQLIGTDCFDQEKVDNAMNELDGTSQKENLGANAILGVSLAVAKAAANEKGINLAEYVKSLLNKATINPFPRLLSNVINGGKHAGSGLAFQEFMVIPNTNNPMDSIEAIFSAQRKLREIIENDFGSHFTGVGDEGGFAPPFTDARAVLEALVIATDSFDVSFGIDVAASSFYENDGYKLESGWVSAAELSSMLVALCDEFRISYLEDPFHEDDFESFAKLRNLVDAKVVGDDLTVTNLDRIEKAVRNESLDGVIIKPNQIGSLSETLNSVEKALDTDLECFASHRSGETTDHFIADLAVGLGCYGIKVGALQRGERVTKYNRLLSLYETR